MTTQKAKKKTKAVQLSKAQKAMMRGSVHFWNAETTDADETKSLRFVGGTNEMSLAEEKLEMVFSSNEVPMAAMTAVAFYSLRRVGRIPDGVEFEDWAKTVAIVEMDDDDPESEAPPA